MTETSLMIYIVLSHDKDVSAQIEKVFLNKNDAIEFVKSQKTKVNGWLTITAYKLENVFEEDEEELHRKEELNKFEEDYQVLLKKYKGLLPQVEL